METEIKVLSVDEKKDIITNCGSSKAHILEILLALKIAGKGVIDDESIRLVSEMTGVSKVKICEIIHFYAMLNKENINEKDADDRFASLDYERIKLKALAAVKSMEPAVVIKKIKDSSLRGRGGAGYPTGLKWEMVAQEAQEKYIVCNADEGEYGAFKDKYIIECEPVKLIEGMLIAAYTINACRGYIYLRGEYKCYLGRLRKTIDILKPYFPKGFEMEVILGAGAYICGEETALLSSIEDGIGEPRLKPPFPTSSGLYGRPTLINNVETFAVIPDIISGDSKNTKLISLSGDINNEGVYKVELEKYNVLDIVRLENFGGGIRHGRNLGFVQLGGYSGSILFPEQIHIPYGYEWMEKAALSIGSGAVTVYDNRTWIVDYCKRVITFFIHESCGKCSVCRNGLPYLEHLLERFVQKRAAYGDTDRLLKTAEHISEMAFCGLGKGAVNVLLAALKYRRQEFVRCEMPDDDNAYTSIGRCKG